MKIHGLWALAALMGCIESPESERSRVDGAALDGAALDGAALDGAVLDSAVLDGAVLDGAVLDGAVSEGGPDVPTGGQETANVCPVAVAGEVGPTVRPLEIVELLGSASTDTDGLGLRPMRYRWTVVEQPEGSTTEPVERYRDPRNPTTSGVADDPATPDAQLFVDLAGRYVIDLVVEDSDEALAPSDMCPQPPARVVFEAVYSAEGFHVELVWDTPGDPDPTDAEGTDLDLHLLHPQGRWAQAPFDCHYANPAPDWGDPGPAGDPTLDIDDTNGAGPEIISMRTPEDTEALEGSYCVGVNYYRAENFLNGAHWGPSTATVRIYLDGVIVSEHSRLMEASHHFWEVACIAWEEGAGTIAVVDRYHGGAVDP